MLFFKKVLFALRPPLNKKVFPVYRPGGSKRADWNFFFHLSKKIYFFYFPPVHSSLKKMKLGKKKKRKKKSRPPDWQFYSPTRSTGNDFLLKGGLISSLTLYRKCIKFAHKNGGGHPTPMIPPFLRPCYICPLVLCH